VVPTIARGIAALAAVAVFVVLGVKAYNGVPGKGYTHVYADVPDIGNLLEHDPVRIAGVQVGQITARSITSGGQGRLTLQLDPGVKLRSGTHVLIRANGLLGGRYVELVPGEGAGVLAADATIHGGPNALTFGLPETLDTFDRQTRGALGDTVNGVGLGLLGRGRRLNDTIATTSAAALPFHTLATGILARPGAAGRLLPSLDSATTSLAAHRDNLARIPGALAGALQPLLDEQGALEQALTKAPPALSAATGGLGNGQRLVDSLRSLAQQADLTLPPLPAALHDAALLLTQAPTPLRRTDALLHAAAPAAPGIVRIADSANPLLGPLQQAAENLMPILLEIGRYRCDIENFGAVFRSMTGRGGVGQGPNGPLMEFRVQIGVANPAHVLGLSSLPGSGVHDTYSPPCKYLASTYPGW
jgi:phospholipid/cholesterol/gamma-HCH transport system substrate-binding protein